MPKFLFFLACSAYILIQCLILIFQSYKARWFVPSFLMPKPYQYLKNIELTEFKDCSICLNNETAEKIMVAPCGHSFHEECMVKWLEIKLICPMCRKSLPIYEGE